MKTSFNASVNLSLSSQTNSSDAGALLVREALEKSQVMSFLDNHLSDSRHPDRIVHSLSSQMRTVILQRALGWFDQSDTQTLAKDPVWQLACSDARGLTPLEQPRPSQATLSRLLNALSQEGDNLRTLHDGALKMAVWRWKQQPKLERPHILTLDIDGLPVEVFGHQSGSSYNGYASARIYSPLIASLAETGDLLGGLLREGNAGPAKDASTWIPHLVEQLEQNLHRERYQIQVRIDAGFTDNTTLSALEDKDIHYLGRLKSNSRLQQLAEPYLKRPVGRPPEQLREWCHELSYQADSWEEPRRVVLVVQEKPDDLFPHAFFIVTNLEEYECSAQKLLDLYRKRGKAEAHMGELKSTLDLHLPSTNRGASTVQQVMARNQVNLLLSLYAYQLMHSLRYLMEQQTGKGWSLMRLREQLLKVAATLSVHARQIKVHLSAAADKWWPTLLAALYRPQTE